MDKKSQDKKKKVRTKTRKNQRQLDIECNTGVNPVPRKVVKKLDVPKLRTEAAMSKTAELLSANPRISPKTNKRKKTEDSTDAQTFQEHKKQKVKHEDESIIVGDREGTGNISKLTRKQRRNRKKNNSKKNKYKHLDVSRNLDKTISVIAERTQASHLPVKVENVNRQEKDEERGKACEQSNTEISKLTVQREQNSVKSKLFNVSNVKENAQKRKKKKKKPLGTRVHQAESSTNSIGTKSNSVVCTSDKASAENSNDENMEDDFVHKNKILSKKVSQSMLTSGDKTFQAVKSTKQSKALSVGDKARLKLNAARFRYLNEQLYTSTGKQAFSMFENDPEAFKVYHDGFQAQVSRWPINPLDVIIKQIQSVAPSAVIADFGCGDACLAERVSENKVHSFDLVASKPIITACNIARVPLEQNSVDVAVFCLSLMGTNLSDYLCEANRVLRAGGTLKIAEVVSRFSSVNTFVRNLDILGFHLQKKLLIGKMFLLFTFKKVKDAPPRKQAPRILLKPCHYKRR